MLLSLDVYYGTLHVVYTVCTKCWYDGETSGALNPAYAKEALPVYTYLLDSDWSILYLLCDWSEPACMAWQSLIGY